MYRSKAVIVMLALAGAGLLAACSSSPSSPDVGVMTPETTAEAGAQGGLSTGVQNYNGRGNSVPGTVYVSSQGLYYDTFVTVDPLPFRGRFQLLDNGVTEFGPGDPGYLGGRWWVDSDHDGIMEETDSFFLCPLLPPGRPNR